MKSWTHTIIPTWTSNWSGLEVQTMYALFMSILSLRVTNSCLYSQTYGEDFIATLNAQKKKRKQEKEQKNAKKEVCSFYKTRMHGPALDGKTVFSELFVSYSCPLAVLALSWQRDPFPVRRGQGWTLMSSPSRTTLVGTLTTSRLSLTSPIYRSFYLTQTMQQEYAPWFGVAHEI